MAELRESGVVAA